MRPNLTVFCPYCGTAGRPIARTIPFCSSRCRVSAARAGIFLAEDSTRFDAKVVRDGDCLIFQGDLNHAGYGTFYVGRFSVRAHCFSWVRRYGAIPEGFEVEHTCHRRACVEVRHLKLATHAVNMQRSARDGRMASGERLGLALHPEARARGERVGTAKLTDAQIIEIRARYQRGKRGHGTVVLAREYGVSHETIRYVVNGKGWAHVEQSA